MDKLFDILIPVVIVLFVVGGKLFNLLKEKGFDFGSLLQQDDTPPTGNSTRKSADAQDYNEDEWGNEVIIVPPPPVPMIRQTASVSTEAAYSEPPARKYTYTAQPKVTPAVKNDQVLPELNAAENDEFSSFGHSRSAYYAGYIHNHGRSAIVIHEILAKPKGMEP